MLILEKRSYTKSFASIYDEVMDNVPYEFWYKYVKDILDYYNKKPDKVIDLACGTGNMTLLFAENENWDISGVDLSQDMLDIARRKTEKRNKAIKFYQADLRTFSPELKFDLAVSLFDSLNYILDYDELKNVFYNVYQLLDNDGLFIFDMNTIERLMSIEEGTMLLNGEGFSCFWEDIVDEENKIWKVKLKIYFEEDELDFYEEVHKETAYPISDVLAALKWAGFREIDVFNAYTFKQGKDSDNRVYFAAGKKLLNREKSFFSKTGKKLKWHFLNTFVI